LLGPIAQSITFTSNAPSSAMVGATYDVAATGTSSGIPVTFTSLTPSICTLTGSTVTLIDSGTCTVAADQAAAGDYTAAPQVTQSFTVAPLLPLPTTTPQITG